MGGLAAAGTRTARVATSACGHRVVPSPSPLRRATHPHVRLFAVGRAVHHLGRHEVGRAQRGVRELRLCGRRVLGADGGTRVSAAGVSPFPRPPRYDEASRTHPTQAPWRGQSRRAWRWTRRPGGRSLYTRRGRGAGTNSRECHSSWATGRLRGATCPATVPTAIATQHFAIFSCTCTSLTWPRRPLTGFDVAVENGPRPARGTVAVPVTLAQRDGNLRKHLRRVTGEIGAKGQRTTNGGGSLRKIAQAGVRPCPTRAMCFSRSTNPSQRRLFYWLLKYPAHHAAHLPHERLADARALPLALPHEGAQVAAFAILHHDVYL